MGDPSTVRQPLQPPAPVQLPVGELASQADLGVAGAGADVQSVAEPGGAGEPSGQLAVRHPLGDPVEGPRPVGREMVELSAMVAILACSRAPAIRFATDRTRPTTFERLLRCLKDLDGVTREILTDRDPGGQ